MKATSRFVILSSGLVLLLSVANARAAAGSIHPDTVSPNIETEIFNDAPNWELGTIFRPELDGVITHARVYSLFEESGEHQVRIWRNADEALLAGPLAWSFGGTDGWITLDIPDVTVEADQDYTIAISTTAEGYYPSIGGYFGAGGTNGLYLGWPSGAGVFSDTAGARPATASGNNATYLRDVVFAADLSGSIMRVQGGISVTIADGATNPSATDGTYVGAKAPSTVGVREQTYTILNLGQSNLQLTGNPPVTIGGAHAQDFVVTVQPSASVAGGGSTTFTVQVEPSAIGLREATLTIARGDRPADPYEFAIQGEGLGGGAGVLGSDGIGSDTVFINQTDIQANRFMAPGDLRITELHAKVVAGAAHFVCAVYSDANGVADRLLMSSLPLADATNGWNTFPLTAPLNVTGGEYYWLAVWSDTPNSVLQVDTFGVSYYGGYDYAGLGGQWPDPIELAPGASRTYCIYAEGTPLTQAQGAEVDLRGNGKLIVSGDTTPSALDGTDFGTWLAGSGSVERVFSIANSGLVPLELTNDPPVVITGAQASDFLVTSPPTATIAPGSTSTFTVRFSPSAGGFRAGTIRIANTGGNPGKNPYQFAVQGAGRIPGRESLWPDSKVGADVSDDGTYYQLGTIFRSSVPGAITQLRVFSVEGDYGDHTAYIWRTSDQVVMAGPYTWNFGRVAGWIHLDIPAVNIDPGIDYTVSISTGTGPQRNYANVAADVSVAGDNGEHLSYPANAGVFNENSADTMPFKSWNSSSYLRDVVFVPAGTTAAFPNLVLQGNDVLIPDGFSSPDVTNYTDFGAAAVGDGGTDRTFVIQNTGVAPLNLSATPRVAITGPQAGEFRVLAQPATPVPPSGSSELTIRFTPSAIGLRNALVIIENDDKNPFYFSIAGTGTAAQVRPRIDSITPNLTTGDVTLVWQGDGPQFQVEKATTLTGSFQPVGTPQAERTFTDVGALTTGAASYYRIRQGAGQN